MRWASIVEALLTSVAPSETGRFGPRLTAARRATRFEQSHGVTVTVICVHISCVSFVPDLVEGGVQVRADERHVVGLGARLQIEKNRKRNDAAAAGSTNKQEKSEQMTRACRACGCTLRLSLSRIH